MNEVSNNPDLMTPVIEQVRRLDEAMVQLEAGESDASNEARSAAGAALEALWKVWLWLDRQPGGTSSSADRG